MSAARWMGAAFVMLTAVTARAEAQPTAPAPGLPPAPLTELVTTEPIHALVLAMKGSYDQHQAAFERLGAYLASRGIAPTGPPFARYFSDPTVAEASLVWEVGLPIPEGLSAEEPFEIKELPATLAAVRMHRGSYDELGTAWSALVQWVLTNGYQPLGPAFQVFQGDPSAPVIEMRLPVQKTK